MYFLNSVRNLSGLFAVSDRGTSMLCYCLIFLNIVCSTQFSGGLNTSLK